eukprot:gene6954-14115_t
MSVFQNGIRRSARFTESNQKENNACVESLGNVESNLTKKRKRSVTDKCDKKASKSKGKKSTDRISVVSSLSRASEQKYLSKGFHLIVGIDEAGRGPLAGPVVAAACLLDPSVVVDGIIDSKATKAEDRERVYEQLIAHPGVRWAVSQAEHIEIDEVNILQATLNSMRRASIQLLKESKGLQANKVVALIDGNKIPSAMPVMSECIIKGDGSVYSIAAASIIAKVTRDRIMDRYHEEYPEYGFKQHKGYPTAAHVAALHKHGPCPIHRMTFGPVKKYASVAVNSSSTGNVNETSSTNSRKKGKKT